MSLPKKRGPGRPRKVVPKVKRGLGRPKRIDDVAIFTVNEHLRERMKNERMLRGITRIELADSIGITHHRMEKAETGQNTLPAGLVYLAARAMRMPVENLFRGLPDHRGVPTSPSIEVAASLLTPLSTEMLSRFAKLPPAVQQALVGQLRAMDVTMQPIPKEEPDVEG